MLTPKKVDPIPEFDTGHETTKFMWSKFLEHLELNDFPIQEKIRDALEALAEGTASVVTKGR